MSDNPIDNLLPSLVQCFGVIIIGFLAVKLSIISSNPQALGHYVTKFALPAVFFRAMALIDFGNVNWLFILSVSLAKFILWFAVVILTLIITRPINLGMAGILSMFVTQSNDVALGYPILKGLYPELAEYIYLFAPAQLVLINPLCFVMLEIHEYRIAHGSHHASLGQRIGLVIKKVLINPIVFMTLIGVACNFILQHKLPLVIDKLLTIFADSFAGVALFYLGINMVGKLGKLTVKTGYLICLMVLGKLILMPFLTRELTVHLIKLNWDLNSTLGNSSYANYSSMSFFYGGLPTAPPVFLIANDFQIIPDIVATALVIVTFLSGPTMFITGRMMTMLIVSPDEYDGILQDTAFSVSCISIFTGIWVIVVFVLAKKWRSALHKVTMTYISFVLTSTIGLVLGWLFLERTNDPTPTWGHYIQFAFFFIGVTGCRIWTSILSISMYLVKKHGLECLEKQFVKIFMVGFITPIFITSMLLIGSPRSQVKDIDPSFQYGKSQIITSLVVFLVTIPITVVFLILQFRITNTQSGEEITERLIERCENEDDLEESEWRSNSTTRYHHLNSTEISLSLNNNEIENTDSLFMSHNDAMLNLSDSTQDPMLLNDDRCIDKVIQSTKHILLIIALLVTMGFGFFLCLWRIIKEEISGVYIELEFLDCAFNFGQGFIVWAIFGFDFRLLLKPFQKLLRLWRNVSEFYLPPEGHLSKDVILQRDQFIDLHMEQCKKQIETSIRYKLKQLHNVFSGARLIDWILTNQIVRNRLQAHAFGQSLLIGRLVEHVSKNRNMIDSYVEYYRFLTPE